MFDKIIVITDRRSRLHALRYYQAIKAYLDDKGYTDFRALVAFSGTVIDPELGEDVTYTEAFLNGFPEFQTAERFGAAD